MADENEVEENEAEHELTDIEAATVGFVERGAVGVEFFLTKGENDMADEPEVVEEEATTETTKSWIEQLGENTAIQLIKKAAKILAAEEQDEVEKQNPPKEEEVETMPDKKDDIQTDAQPQVDVEAELNKAIEKAQEKMTADFEAKAEALTKAFEEKQTALNEDVEKANANAAIFKANAAQEREQRERREFVTKAGDYDNLPISADELGNYLYELSKWDEGANVELAKSKDHEEKDNQNRLGWLEDVLKAANEQIKESKFYVEAGSSHIPELSKGGIVAKAQELMKEDPELTLEKAMMQLPADFVAKNRNK